ncbi:MAG: hypothetical protein R3B47_16550 [Bacteroidia bacterium]
MKTLARILPCLLILVFACQKPNENLEKKLIDASNKQDYQEVIAISDKILSIDSTNLLAIQERCLGGVYSENDTVWPSFMEKVLSTQPVRGRAYYNLALAHMSLSAHCCPKPSNDSMASLFKNAFYLSENDPFLQKQIIVFSEAFDRKSSISMAEAVLQKEPENHELWARLGRLLHEEKRSEEAVKIYRKTIELEPRFFIPYLELSMIFQEMGDSALAQNFSNTGFEVAKKYPEINSPSFRQQSGNATTFSGDTVRIKK